MATISFASVQVLALAGDGMTCAGEQVTIMGTPGDDEIQGTPGDDVIAGLDGDDVIEGLGGRDVICGDEGDDHLFGDEGGGQLVGGPGDDRLHGRGGLFGGPGDDVMKGLDPLGNGYSADPGDDRIIDEGGQGAISYEQAPHGLRADLREGTVRGWGQDTVIGMRSFGGSEHDDVLLGSGADEYMYGDEGSDRIHGRGGDDVLQGRGVLVGGRGNDDFRGDENEEGSGTVLRGGPGSDAVDFTLRVRADLREGIARGSGNRFQILRSIENLSASFPGSVLIGDRGDNVLLSDGGTADKPVVLRGRGGDDVLGPSLTFDPLYLVLYGGAGGDVLRGGARDDVLYGGPGDDKMRGERFAYYVPSDDLLDGGKGKDGLNGGPGTDDCLRGEKVKNCES